MEDQTENLTAYQGKDKFKSENNETYCNMSEEKDNLKSIKVYKFNNTKEGWHEFALKFRVIADSGGYDDIIEGKETPPDEKEDLEILDKDDTEVKQSKKAKQLMRATNKKGVQRPSNDHRGHFTQHCRELNFRQVDERRSKEGMGETRETLEPQNKRRQS